MFGTMQRVVPARSTSAVLSRSGLISISALRDIRNRDATAAVASSSGSCVSGPSAILLSSFSAISLRSYGLPMSGLGKPCQHRTPHSELHQRGDATWVGAPELEPVGVVVGGNAEEGVAVAGAEAALFDVE
eukprot:2717627-Rhodomonas_salina.1